MTQFSPWAYPKENLHTYFNRTTGRIRIQLLIFLHVECFHICAYLFFVNCCFSCFFQLASAFAIFSSADNWAIQCDMVRLFLGYLRDLLREGGRFWLFRSAYLSLVLGTNVNETDWTVIITKLLFDKMEQNG